MLELTKHSGDEDVARRIVGEEAFLHDKGTDWCAQMISRADLISPAITAFSKAMPGSDRRHRQNMATLLSGAFVALQGRPPSEDEAKEWATDFIPTIELHAEVLDRDDALECLDHLFAHVVDDHRLGDLVSRGMRSRSANVDLPAMLRRFDMLIKEHEGAPVLFIRNGAAGVEGIFKGTIWEGGAWQTALRKLPSSFTPKNPIYFPSVGRKSRSIAIPLALIPDQPNQKGDF